MKDILRTNILSQRKALSINQVEAMSREIYLKVLEYEYYKKAQNIFIYLDFRNEVKTRDIIAHALANNKRVAIPICINETRQITLAEITSFEDLTKNKLGILEVPKNKIRIVDRNIIDLAFVPGVGFDRKGNRLGFGAGYYDRFFNSCKAIPKAALAYSFQIIDGLTAEEHDVPMDIIFTEKEKIICSGLYT